MRKNLLIHVCLLAMCIPFITGCKNPYKKISIPASGEEEEQAKGPVPVTYIMVCCHEMDKGTRFLVNGEWDSKHDYRDIETTRGLLTLIKEAGINVIGIDFTNPAQWDEYESTFTPMLNNVRKVTQELGMEYFLFLGNTAAWTMEYWNDKAKFIWENLVANDPNYRRYGFGDDRPMLTIFLPGEDFKRQWDASPDSSKDYLSKFRIGTCQVNDPIRFTNTDAWGYRNMSQSADGKVRFVAPNSGVPPQDWKRIGPKEWKNRVEWSLGAKEYAVIGTYDDTCDAIFWGIADVRESQSAVHVNDSTKLEPSAYYDIVKAALAQ